MSKKGLDMKYFVLNPNKADKYGEASREAISKYADIIQEENIELAEDLRYWLKHIDFNVTLAQGKAKLRS